MKTQLTAEESAKLIELGVGSGKANGLWLPGTDAIIPFTLADILGILPKEIDYNGLTYGLNMWVDRAIWHVEYVAEVKFGQFDALNADNLKAPELIDALYSLLVWCLEKGYVKLN